MNNKWESNRPKLSSFGLRFCDPVVEERFRLDRAQHVQNQLRTVGAISGIYWAFWPFVHLFIPEFAEYVPGTLFLSWVFAVPLCLMGVFNKRLPLIRSQPIFFASFAMILISTALVIWFGWAATPSFPGNEMVMFGCVVGLWVPFLRLPSKAAFVTITCLMVPGGASLLYEWLGPEAQMQSLIWGSGSLVAAVGIITGVAVSLELSMRQSFAKSMQIECQNKSIERSRELISRYVPASVSACIFQGRSDEVRVPQRRRVTIMFADISGFTEIADRVEPEVMTEVIGDHLAAMTQIVEAWGGTISEFAGDGLMALFGAPDVMPPERQVMSALSAAQAMQHQMTDLNRCWKRLGLDNELRIRIGVHTGMVSVGSFGSAGRMTYTAMGLQTNIASRIESAAQPGWILISDACFQLVQDQVACEPQGEIECKGVHYPIKVYCPKLIRDQAREAVATI